MEVAYALIAMLSLLALVGLLSHVVNIPYPILLFAGGLGLVAIPGLRPPPLDPDLILLFFLPPLLYKEAFDASWRDFSHWFRPIFLLGVGLVAVTVVAVGLVAKYLFPELPWAVAFMLGAVVSPTDTVAVMAVVHRLRVPRRLSAILGGESLINDATGLVAMQLALGVLLAGSFTWTEIGLRFVWTVAGGVGIGLLVGWMAAFVNRRVRETTVLFACSLIAPYIAFSAAHALHVSGVLAVVVAGFYVSWRIHTVSANTRYQLYAVWRLLAYLIDGFCFVLIGTEIPRLLRAAPSTALPYALMAGGVITAVVILLRFIWTFPAAYLPPWLDSVLWRRAGDYPPVRNVVLVSWCGVRGAVSLAAALSVPLLVNGEPFPGRDALIFCTLVVILGTLLTQGLTLAPLVRLLGIRGDSRAYEEERLARVSLIQAALQRLDDLKAADGTQRETADHVEGHYMERLDRLIQSTRYDSARNAPAQGRRLFEMELEALQAEREQLLTLRDAARINDVTQMRLQEELDIAEMRLRTALRGVAEEEEKF